MAQYILRRVALLIPVLLGVSLVVFTLVRLIPGMPRCWRSGSTSGSPPSNASWCASRTVSISRSRCSTPAGCSTCCRGPGTSLRTRRSVNEELRLRLPVTIELTLLAALLGTVPAMAVGVLAAVRRNSALDYAATIGTLIGVSVPNFLLATLLVLVFSLWLRWLPPIGYVELTKDPIENLRTMLCRRSASACRWQPSSCEHLLAVLEVLGQEHVRVARAKGSPSGGSSAAT